MEVQQQKINAVFIADRAMLLIVTQIQSWIQAIYNSFTV
jgi:hypothetical protein